MPSVVVHLVAGAQEAETIANPANRSMFQLGCVLPDFVGMYEDYSDSEKIETRSVYSPDDSQWLDLGVFWHYRTDEAYQRCPVKSDLLTALETDFEDFDASNSMGKFAVRACAHAGTKMLLDGVLIQKPEVRDMYDRFRNSVLLPPGIMAANIFEPVTEAVFKYFRDVRSGEDFIDARWVACSLHKRINSRLGEAADFPEGVIDLVEHCLKQQLSRLKLNGQKIMEFIMEDVSSSTARVPFKVL